MIKIDLITGFLGSGKTTFLKKYAGFLMKKGMHIGILENDYGAVNVDMMLLQDLIGENCELEMVIGGDYDCHRRRFRTKLIAMAMSGYDRVLVEPSGVYDVDEFFDVLHEEPLDRWYEIGNVISIVDAALPESLSRESDYLLVSQTANAGRIVLSKVQEAEEGETEATVRHLNRAMEQFGCERKIDDVLKKNWEELTDGDLEELLSCGYEIFDHVKLPVERENSFSSLFYMKPELTPEELQERANQILRDPSCGEVLRIKGFLPADGGWTEINATRGNMELSRVPKGQEIIIVIGEKLKKDRIDAVLTGKMLLPS